MSVRRLSFLHLAAPILLFVACGSSDPDSGDATTAAGAGAANSPTGTGGTDTATTGGQTAGGAGGTPTSGGSPNTGGSVSSGGENTAGGAPTAGGAGGETATAGAASGGQGGAPVSLENFSFFVTSYAAMVRLSGTDDGFGGDLRYGEADGLAGADKICTEIAETSMPGSSAKQWRAFLSVNQGPDDNPVNAISRIGEGPWYDRLGRVVAMNPAALQNDRPEGSDQLIREDLPNEDGVPNHRPDPTQPEVDNHHMLTGSNENGEVLSRSDGTCNDWTSKETDIGRPRIGFSWSISNRTHWISGQDEGGCGAGFDLDGGGGSDPNNPIVGSGGGYGGIYCFALTP